MALGLGTARGSVARRSPLLFGAVSAAHAVLIGALLQGQIRAPLLEGLRVPTAGGGGQRLEVVLLEPAPREFTPPLVTTLQIVTPMTIDLPTLPTLPTLELEPAELSAAEQLQGLYLGQVRARISRAWEALGAGPSPTLPDCLVNVTQDLRGQVLDVAITGCSVDDLSKAQVLRAVRAAAPLPAPPAGLPFRSQVEFRLLVGR
jgi:hypothetical protein